MKQNWTNKVHVEGYVFSHSLQEKVSGPNAKRPGVKFIQGDLEVATDLDAVNVVKVHWSYVVPTYVNKKTGQEQENATYTVLKQIIDENRTFENVGASAIKVRIDGSIELNDFYTREWELASPMRISGSFCHILTSGISDKPATFEVEMVINNAVERETNDSSFMNLEGYIFNFRNDILPVKFSMTNSAGIDYFNKQDISITSPFVTKIWGNIITNTVTNVVETESAFGAPTVNATTRSFRSWDVEGASAEPMIFGEDSVITMEDIQKALVTREAYLASEKKRTEEWRNSRPASFGAVATTPATSPTASQNYKF